MKTCCAGHELIVFGSARCPLCAQRDRMDLLMLKIDVQQEQLEEARVRINKLTNKKVSNLKEQWKGGAT